MLCPELDRRTFRGSQQATATCRLLVQLQRLAHQTVRYTGCTRCTLGRLCFPFVRNYLVLTTLLPGLSWQLPKSLKEVS